MITALASFVVLRVLISKSRVTAGNIVYKRFKGSGLRYEVGLSVKKGDICWIFGPFNVEKSFIWWFLGWDQSKSWAEEGKWLQMGFWTWGPLQSQSIGDNFSKPQNQAMEQGVTAWHKHCNRRMKQWAVLHQEYLHDLNLHESVFCAIAFVTQICIQKGEPLATVSYKE